MDIIQLGPTESVCQAGHGAIILPICSICNQVPAEGIGGVIRVGKAWICSQCEQEIVNLEVGSPKYGLILDKIRKVWR